RRSCAASPSGGRAWSARARWSPATSRRSRWSSATPLASSIGSTSTATACTVTPTIHPMSADVARQRPVRLGVVGVGQMGANHARVASELKGAELVAVVDHDRDRAKAAAEGHGARAVELDELADLV